jgi:hypothetical protein
MPYTRKCPQCHKTYTTKDKRQKYCAKECYYAFLQDPTNNAFFGKTHSTEKRKEISQKVKGLNKGEMNPFFGKTHSKEVKDKIKKGGEKWREENRETLLEKRLEKKGLSRESIIEHWEYYCDNPVNNDYFREVVGVDPRTFQKFLLDCDLVTLEEIERIGEEKKLFRRGHSISRPEMIINNMLVERYGAKNVIHQAKRFGYYYDFCVLGRFLVEYDGYYFHKVLKNKNDSIKEHLARENGFILYRVEEPENRKTDYEREFQNIVELIEENMGVKDEI